MIEAAPGRVNGGHPSSDGSSPTSASARPPRGPKKAKTAEELDKELDAFMGDGDVPEPAAAAAQDVDMV